MVKGGMKKSTPQKPPASRPSSDAFTPEQEAALRRLFPGEDWSKAKIAVENGKPVQTPKKK